MDKCDKAITDFIINKNYNDFQSKIWGIIDNYKNNDILEEELKKIIKNEEQNHFFDLINAYSSAFNELENIKILRDNPKIDTDIFKNKNLEENIKVLNLFCIQGSQGCGFFVLPHLNI